jgi:hypothetical protein
MFAAVDILKLDVDRRAGVGDRERQRGIRLATICTIQPPWLCPQMPARFSSINGWSRSIASAARACRVRPSKP